MNLLYMKYAVEVAACGSVNKAAEKLYIGQPNLSRAIRELESSLGISIFERSARGMVVTHDGELFLKHAKDILSQVESLENLLKNESLKNRAFSISVTGSDYISEAFSKFSNTLRLEKRFDAFYDESDTESIIENVFCGNCRLGIIRYEEGYEGYFKKLLEEKKLDHDMVCEFRQDIVVSSESQLARLSSLTEEDLEGYIEIVPSEQSVFSPAPKEQQSERSKRIYISDRCARYELLASNPRSYTRSAPIPQRLRLRYGLTRLNASWESPLFNDLLIYRRDCKFSALDLAFISELNSAKREIFK